MRLTVCLVLILMPATGSAQDPRLPETNHPRSNTGLKHALPWHLSVQRYLTSWYGVGVSMGRGPIGTTVGQKRDTFASVNLSYAVTTVAPLFIVAHPDGFHAAAGPALLSTRFADGSWMGSWRESRRDVGFVSEIGLALPQRSRVFGQVLVQYRFAGDVAAGPFPARDDPLRSRLSPSDGPATLPRSTVRIRHWFGGMGVGVRF